MSLDVGFVLAAGKGTRMGPLGEVLPKPLWPVFDLSLFQLSLRQLSELGVKRIYANIHHCSELIEKHVAKHGLDVHLLLEKPLLGSGGAFHNLKLKTGETRVLAVNSDSLYLFTPKVREDLKSSGDLEEHLLLGQKVKKEDGYNEWITENGELVRISGPSSKNVYWTFSGVSSINLKKLKPLAGKSSFFQTVANPSEKNTRIIEKEFPIYDYGTLEQYEHSIWRTFNDEKLRERLLSLGAIDPDKLKLLAQSYGCDSGNVLNFTSRELAVSDPGIYLSSGDSIYRVWQGQTSLVSFE